MQGNSARSVVVGSGGSGVVAHVGLHALCSFADRLGLGAALSSRIPLRGERFPLHDRGKVLVQQMAVIAGGGESCADIEYLRSEASLFGFVPSDSTVWRTFHEIKPETRDDLKGAVAEVRAEVWRRSAGTAGTDPVTLDVDASLVTIHTDDKPGTGPTYRDPGVECLPSSEKTPLFGGEVRHFLKGGARQHTQFISIASDYAAQSDHQWISSYQK
jgi:hypothetical protein